VAARGAAYGIASVAIDGNDVLAVEAAAAEAIQRARSGGGPTLLECKTYRTRPHSEGMGDYTYRTREDVERWRALCPIKRLRETLVSRHLAGESELDAIDREVETLAEQSEMFAELSPFPAPASATDSVYAPARTGAARDLPESPRSTRVLSFMKATLEALSEEMEKDPSIFVLGEGIGVRGGNFATTTGLFAKYGPERLRDTPICERGFVGLACGAAMSGTRPVVDFMFADFVLDAAGEIINQIAKMQYMSSGRLQMPVLLRGCIGIGHAAATHHSGSYYSMYANFPGLRVVVPSNPRDAKGLLKTALTCGDPVLFLEHRELMAVKDEVPEEEYYIDFGRATVVRAGTDVTVVALALMVHKTLEACALLAEEGVSVELIDPRTVAPLDMETIRRSVQKTGRLLIVDEAFGPFGVGAEIAAQVADAGFDDLDAPIRRLNGKHSPTPYSATLEAAVVPDVESIRQSILALAND
jgi:2-oxoisovalerate dehydrogenase E1 component